MKRNVKEQFRELVRGLDGQIKEATVRVARANEKGKQNMMERPSLGCKSYFGTEAAVLLLHALRLSSRFFISCPRKHILSHSGFQACELRGLGMVGSKQIDTCIRAHAHSRFSLIVKLLIQGP